MMMVLNILVSLIWGRSTARENSYTRTVLSTRVSGRITRCTAKVYVVSHLVMYMMVIGPTMKFMVWDVLQKLMVTHIMETGFKENVMAKARKLWQTRKSMKVSGRMTCATVRVFFVFWKMEKPLKPTRGNLTTESFKVLVVIHTQMVMFMKVHLSMRRNKERENTPVLTELYTRATIMMKCVMVTEYSLVVSSHTKVISRMTCSMVKVS